ncbi:MAG: DUF308 domain-containing protein [Parvibaculum sp.]|uniref:HdeD family acid-resistance protein n=1 Tax=Parvibaculum sp. TaxID=2024848 RepID=UPI0025CE029E|nr:DUF308 domain-containing protein [Parvibaculum sp.]MCE9648671.1 DUF308 domain-containing protein [Parvibaculum sp.]
MSIDKAEAAIAEAIHSQRRVYVVAGGLLVLGGLLCIAFPFFGTLAVAIFVGWVLVFSGLVEVIHALTTRGAPAMMLNAVVGLLSLGVGVLVLSDPFSGALSLTLLIAGLFAADGTIRILSAAQIRPFAGWGWIVLNGVSSLLLAAVLLWLLPDASLYVLGILLGLDLLVAGGSLLLIASAARTLAGLFES